MERRTSKRKMKREKEFVTRATTAAAVAAAGMGNDGTDKDKN